MVSYQRCFAIRARTFISYLEIEEIQQSPSLYIYEKRLDRLYLKDLRRFVKPVNGYFQEWALMHSEVKKITEWKHEISPLP